jgi:glucose/mannose-6-phosphate isomerase
MIDDLKYIHEHDVNDALGVAAKQYVQLEHSFGTDVQNLREKGIRNVVLAGMGGSALPGVFLKAWPGTRVPFDIVRDYELPEYVDERTLVISSSHSGNTEETLSALADAENKGAQIIVIAAGGKLAALAQEKSYPLFTVPTGIQPRMSSYFFLVALVDILEQIGVVPEGSLAELRDVGPWLREMVTDWLPDVPTSRNSAKQLALELLGKSVVVYSGPKLFPVANKFKICLNENAKNIAWVNQYPEFNHNEFIGWSSHPLDKPYAVVDIRSGLEHPRVQKRFIVAERLLSGKRPAPEVIEPQGQSLIQQLLWTSNYCDFVSIYVALLNGLNPTPVDLVEKFKIALDE